RVRWENPSGSCYGNAPSCVSYTEHTMWDGDQIATEFRTGADVESDYPASGNFFGSVRYTHGGGLDQPLAVWKSGIGGIVPHRSWRGTYEDGTGVSGS